jgi:maltooligosyltrehalose synthase
MLVTAVPRLVHRLYRDGAIAVWGTSELALSARAAWCDVFTGREWVGCERIPVSDLLADFPVAVLVEVNGS